jgi:hypothetical protein
MVVAAMTAETVVPGAIFGPLTAIPATMLSVPANVRLVPAAIIALGDAVIWEPPEANVRTSTGFTPPARRGVLSVTVVVVRTCATVVPGAILVPLMGMPTPIPSRVPPGLNAGNVKVVAVEPLGDALNAGMTYPFVKASRSRLKYPCGSFAARSCVQTKKSVFRYVSGGFGGGFGVGSVVASQSATSCASGVPTNSVIVGLVDAAEIPSAISLRAAWNEQY